MHREYHPASMDQLRAQAFGAGHTHDHDHGPHPAHDHDHDHESHRALFALTTLMGLLLAGELLFGWLGWEHWRAPGGISLALIAAVIGGSRIVYGALEALIHGSIGADIALAQACLAALVIGQPFVAAEVVFIALVGEVLEAITFERAAARDPPVARSNPAHRASAVTGWRSRSRRERSASATSW